jgi:alpha-beta hydrolase superfamily lysophospholipase
VLISHRGAEALRPEPGRSRDRQRRGAALAYDVRGHGKSPGERGYIERFGSTSIALRARADERPPKVAAAIASSPFLATRLAVPGFPLRLAAFGEPRRAEAGPAQRASRRRSHTRPGPADQAVADELCFDVATARWFTEDYVFAHADRIAIPTTWLVGGDPIADPARSRAVAAKIAGANYHDVVGMRHEIFNELERGRVFSDLSQALDAASAAARR